MAQSDTEQFLCLLGIDGSGKSTLLNAVTAQYPEIVVADRHQFPAVSQIATLPRGLTPGEVLCQLGPHARAAQLWYFAALEYDTLIQPAVAAGRPIIVDSYWYKFTAKMRVLDMAAPFLYAACATLPHPKKIIFLDTPPEIAFRRARERQKTLEFFECKGHPSEFIPFQRAIREEMLRFIHPLPHVYLDGRLPVDELARLMIDVCAAAFNLSFKQVKRSEPSS